MKQTSFFQRTVAFALLALPQIAQAHPGHLAMDASAGAPHSGHSSEWVSMIVFVALTGAVLGMRSLSRRNH
jgi:hypothetical protein